MMGDLADARRAEPAPGFHVTTRVDGETVTFRRAITDPFIRHTVTVDTWPVPWLPWLLRQRHVVEVIIDADQATMTGVFRVLETPPPERNTRGPRIIPVRPRT